MSICFGGSRFPHFPVVYHWLFTLWEISPMACNIYLPVPDGFRFVPSHSWLSRRRTTRPANSCPDRVSGGPAVISARIIASACAWQPTGRFPIYRSQRFFPRFFRSPARERSSRSLLAALDPDYIRLQERKQMTKSKSILQQSARHVRWNVTGGGGQRREPLDGLRVLLSSWASSFLPLASSITYSWSKELSSPRMSILSVVEMTTFCISGTQPRGRKAFLQFPSEATHLAHFTATYKPARLNLVARIWKTSWKISRPWVPIARKVHFAKKKGRKVEISTEKLSSHFLSSTEDLVNDFHDASFNENECKMLKGLITKNFASLNFCNIFQL